MGKETCVPRYVTRPSSAMRWILDDDRKGRKRGEVRKRRARLSVGAEGVRKDAADCAQRPGSAENDRGQRSPRRGRQHRPIFAPPRSLLSSSRQFPTEWKPQRPRCFPRSLGAPRLRPRRTLGTWRYDDGCATQRALGNINNSPGSRHAAKERDRTQSPHGTPTPPLQGSGKAAVAFALHCAHGAQPYVIATAHARAVKQHYFYNFL